MPVTVIVELLAKPGQGDALGNALRDLYPVLAKNTGGLLAIDQYRDVDDPDRIVEVETWQEHGQHAAWSEQAMAAGTFATVFPLLAGAPVVHSFDHTGSMEANP